MTEQFWIYNPYLLFESITKIWPKSGMEFNEKLNALSRLIFILTSLGYLFTKNLKIVVSGVVTLIILVLYHKKEEPKRKEKEGFKNYEEDINNDISKIFTSPKDSNPLMNVNLDEYKKNPERKMAEPAFDEKDEEKINDSALNFIDNNLNNTLIKDLGDATNFENSMRNFYTMPSTTIPNNQKAFSEFCYGSMKSCRDGEYDQCSKIATENLR
jgi:hypothetical protein